MKAAGALSDTEMIEELADGGIDMSSVHSGVNRFSTRQLQIMVAQLRRRLGK